MQRREDPGDRFEGESSLWDVASHVSAIIDFGLATTTVGDGLTAIGALAYHLVCGRPPFAGDNPIAIGIAHLSEPVVPPRQLRRDVQPALEAAILAALAKAPEDRPASARAFTDQAFAA